ncbi:MAG: GtrA family protein [Tannerella sp.]|jgi:putative flippase GtrA|nr:GtrA family protein [Tannerella sp.]
MEVIKQGIKYGVVGIGNTLLSLIIIWIMTKPGGCPETISNLTGYTVGLINSYLWNKKWTFRSEGNWTGSAIRFFGVFAVCYLMQLGLLLALNRYCPENPPLYGFFKPLLLMFKIDAPFYNQILAMFFYTLANFIINKFYTFKT